MLIAIKNEVIAEVMKPNTNLFLKLICSFVSDITLRIIISLDYKELVIPLQIHLILHFNNIL